VHSERTLFDLTGLIYDAASDASRWPAFLANLARTLRGAGANIFVQDLHDHRFNVAAQLGFDPQSERSYESYYRSRNIYLIRGNRCLQTGSVCLSHALCPDRLALRSEFFNDWIAPQKQHYGVLGVIYRRRSLASMVGAIRERGKPPFGREEVSVVKLLLPHLQRAVTLHRKIADLESQKHNATNALDKWALGVILLDEQARILLMNRAAEQIVGEKDGLVVNTCGLSAASAADASELRRLVRDAIATRLGRGGQSGGAMTLARPSLKRSLDVLVAPLFDSKPFAGHHGAVATVFVSDPDAEEQGDTSVLRRLYGLTQAEADVTGCLATGEDLKRTAELLGVSMNTARTHLKKVFEKTGAKRQSELVRLILRSPMQVRRNS
jgi:DNA-binding CsgD family transcriptional regulator